MAGSAAAALGGPNWPGFGLSDLGKSKLMLSSRDANHSGGPEVGEELHFCFVAKAVHIVLNEIAPAALGNPFRLWVTPLAVKSRVRTTGLQIALLALQHRSWLPRWQQPSSPRPIHAHATFRFTVTEKRKPLIRGGTEGASKSGLPVPPIQPVRRKFTKE